MSLQVIFNIVVVMFTVSNQAILLVQSPMNQDWMANILVILSLRLNSAWLICLPACRKTYSKTFRRFAFVASL